MKFLLFLLCAKIILADYISNSPCIDRPVQEYFELEKVSKIYKRQNLIYNFMHLNILLKISGRWYMIAKYESSYEQSTDCNYGDYESIDKHSLKSSDCELVNGTYHCLKGIFRTELSDQFPLGFKHSYVFSDDRKYFRLNKKNLNKKT